MMSTAATFSLADLKKAQPISGWQDFQKEGEQYLRTATGAHARRKAVFTPAILYNLIAIAIEKLAMASLMQRGALPYNHTMADLVEALEAVVPDEIEGLKAQLLDLDRYQEICDVDTFTIRPPTFDEIPAMLNVAEELQRLARHLTGET